MVLQRATWRPSSPMIHSIISIPTSSSSSPLLSLFPLQYSSLPLLPFLSLCKLPEESTMKTYSQDNEEAKKEQQREASCKGDCDYNPSKSSPESDDILPHILKLYGSHATPQDFEIYTPDATFEDPLMRAHGVKQIKSAFYSLSKIFSESRIMEYSIEENVISQGKKEILIDNKQYYKFLGRDIHMISLIKLYVEGGKVVRHEDWWDKKPLWNRATAKLPFVGRILEISRRGSMLATHAMMRFGKDPTM